MLKFLVQPVVNVRHLRAKFMYSVGQCWLQGLSRREREGSRGKSSGVGAVEKGAGNDLRQLLLLLPAKQQIMWQGHVVAVRAFVLQLYELPSLP